MKKQILILLFFSVLNTISQEHREFSILTNPNNWQTEIITFPIDWAPKVKLLGFEELQFTPNWKNKKHEEFWSLIMAWSIDAKSTLSKSLITSNFVGYFDGLMKPNHWATDFSTPKIEELTADKESDNFRYKMTFFDGFHTGKLITVNIKAKQVYCEIKQRAIITFYISPQKLNSRIWNNLEKIKLNPKFCNLNEKASLIALDSTWKKEIFPFPISFAPKLPYVGFEEARFPAQGWLNEEHSNFWSYTFAWKIDTVVNFDAKKLTENLQDYFDGLSNNKDFKSKGSIVKIKSEKDEEQYKGKITIYDRFTTKKPLLLNLQIDKKICTKTDETILLFKFSPKSFNHKTWQMLENIKLVSPICN